MSSRISELQQSISELEQELEREFNAARDAWSYRIEAGRIRFEREAREAHARLKQRIPAYLRDSSVRNILSIPVIWTVIVPIACLDAWVTVYQAICFRLYGISRVRRSAYIVIDHRHLEYLNAIERLNCVYCGYANGVLAYVREIAGRTEQYWCPIRHATRIKAPHTHYRDFVDFADAQGHKRRLLSLRSELKSDDQTE
ncbi:MAG TPA: hypothetical protein VEK56_16010 [Vicinamibacterales bacterium]|nr:hypothetical protein [Vicinamibacterales bacterium]